MLTETRRRSGRGTLGGNPAIRDHRETSRRAGHAWRYYTNLSCCETVAFMRLQRNVLRNALSTLSPRTPALPGSHSPKCTHMVVGLTHSRTHSLTHSRGDTLESALSLSPPLPPTNTYYAKGACPQPDHWLCEFSAQTGSSRRPISGACIASHHNPWMDS